MSKSDELRILRKQCSTDAPVKVRYRTGDGADVGTMLDLYVQTPSSEDTFLKKLDDQAREKFRKGFQLYLKKVFSKQERMLLIQLIKRRDIFYTARGTLRVEYIAVLQSIQRKAYDNTEPLIELARATAWSGAENFISTVYETLTKIQSGLSVNESLLQYQRDEEQRRETNERMREYNSNWRKAHPEQVQEIRKQWREKNKEHIRTYNKEYRARAKAVKNAVKTKKIDLRKELELSFEKLSESLKEWIEAGKPADGVIFNTFELAAAEVDEKFSRWYRKAQSLQRK